MKQEEHIPQVAILMNTENEWCSSLVNGIISYAQEAGPWNIWFRRASPRIFEHIPLDWKGDGIIARVANNSLAKEISKSGIPFVNVDDSPPPGLFAPSVMTDNAAGTQMAVNFFVERGFHSIALAGSRRTPMTIKYTESFEQAVAAYKLPFQFFEIYGNRGELKDRLVAWLHELPKPTGLLSCGVTGAAWIADCCREEDISVPHDIAILSSRFDKIICNSCYPPLSGLIAPTEEIGHQAAAQLHRMMQGDKVTNDNTYLPPLGILEQQSTDTIAVEDPDLAKAMKFLQAHACEPNPMEQLDRIIPMCRRSLERRFVKTYKRTPSEEIRKLRMNRAQELLAETDLPIQEIAEASGYSNYNYLSHAFKKATGMTPTAYRKQFR
ncbi:substrate-binding domain-containing protein [Pontiella agarivorans]|uniref:Helix-turn-helix domain-containing protein n=1 Tax=Pontiella agarivorans TaxID=3038953 RepID=A0ABU5N1A5_9BACT|nr:helix-turn-helix domain-containing protein [Pontiella agarivorans]MDZ8120231.1 helix-turn-helix domain-containing protein [Pontiella agarivorans]